MAPNKIEWSDKLIDDWWLACVVRQSVTSIYLEMRIKRATIFSSVVAMTNGRPDDAALAITFWSS